MLFIYLLIYVIYFVGYYLYANVVVFVFGCFYFLATGCGRYSRLSFTGVIFW